MRSQPRFLTASLVFVFIVLIWGPLVKSMVEPDADFDPVEKRRLTTLPNIDWRQITALPTALEAYYQDHFGFREQFVRAHHSILHKCMGVPSERVVIGKDGWLFADLNDSMDQFRGV